MTNYYYYFFVHFKALVVSFNILVQVDHYINSKVKLFDSLIPTILLIILLRTQSPIAIVLLVVQVQTIQFLRTS